MAALRFLRKSSTISGTMSNYPLTLNSFFRRAERYFPKKEIVTGTATGAFTRTNYGEWADRSRRIPGILDSLGIKKGARVGSFAWNSDHHLELWYAVPCAERVLHTLNIRLFPEQLVFVVNDAQDEIIFVSRSLMGLIWPHAAKMTTVKHFVVMDDGAGPIPSDPRVLLYEDLIKAHKPGDLTAKDELAPASICYTSGTTGHPKGVVYTHRSLYLHTLGLLSADSLGVTESDVVLPVVPMFHANSWGLSHASVAAGSKLVMPGPLLKPEPLAHMIEKERVTVAAGVPTIWMDLLPALKGKDTSSLRSIPCGGSAVPKNLSVGYRKQLGIPLLQAWGMTETSPLGSTCQIPSHMKHLPEDQLDEIRTSIGRAVVGVEARIVNDDGKELPWDGKSTGELQVTGPWVASSYLNLEKSDAFTADGWLRTGDVAVFDEHGFMYLKDRTKDLIKTGGEWISSVEVENEIMSHPKVKEAAVIAVHSRKWMERPWACVVLKPDETLTHEELNAYLAPRMAKWWLPDGISVIDSIPRTSVGKFDKKVLRARFHHLTVH